MNDLMVNHHSGVLVSNKKIQTTDICNSTGESQNHYVYEKYQTQKNYTLDSSIHMKLKKCKIHV